MRVNSAKIKESFNKVQQLDFKILFLSLKARLTTYISMNTEKKPIVKVEVWNIVYNLIGTITSTYDSMTHYGNIGNSQMSK